MSYRSKSSSKLKIEKNQSNLKTFINRPSPVATSTPKKRAASSPENNSTSAKRRPKMMEDNHPTSVDNTDKNKTVTVLQLEQMEERMTKALAATIQSSVNTAIDEKLKPIQQSIEQLLETKEENEKFREDVTKLVKENKTITNRCVHIEKENKKLKDRLNDLENKLLDCSIIVHGITEEVDETEAERREKLIVIMARTIRRQTMDECIEVARNVPIKSTQRLGRFVANRNRPISVTFENKSDADHLFENKTRLGKGIFADREYCQETERERQYLRPILKQCRCLDDYKGVCKMEGTTLKIKGKRYTRENLHQLPEEISAFASTSKSNDNTLGFFGELNPLSNFHVCFFEWNGIRFHSSEQFIQYQKAMLFKDQKTADLIMKCTTALECKQMASSVLNFSSMEWNSKAKELCKPGIKCKFQQNASLATTLIETGDKLLVESCYDKVWGTGKPLFEENCLDVSRCNQGILGEILCEIRSELQDISVDNIESRT